MTARTEDKKMTEEDCGKDIPDPGCQIRSRGVGGNRTNGEMTEIGGESDRGRANTKREECAVADQKGEGLLRAVKPMVS
jgi:hypothetical protein